MTESRRRAWNGRRAPLATPPVLRFVSLSMLLVVPAAAPAQERSTGEVLAAIREEGTERSLLETLAVALLDSIGPRLTGTPGQLAAHGWAAGVLASWGLEARNETYGEWTGWRRGTAHVDLLSPRVRTLEARLVAYSRGTGGSVTGEVIPLPDVADPASFRAWLPAVAGRFVLVSAPAPSCRPLESWQRWADPPGLAAHAARVARSDSAWSRRVAAAGVPPWQLARLLGDAGAAGVLESEWTGGWGTEVVHEAYTRTVPVLSIGCEDHGLLHRLAAAGGATLRVDAVAEHTGPAPAMNTLGFLRGGTLPGEFVVLSAHFDSWDAASGATDNGSGVLVMMEAMRILRAVLPRPRRTILLGLWGGEEQGLNGSRAFAEDHPRVLDGIQLVLNQDTGTGRIDRVSLQGFAAVGERLRGWLALADPGWAIELDDPGMPSAGSSDHSSFVCRGIPALWMLSASWDYGTYTWHTTRDTPDKLVFPELRRNAVLVAMLAYLASESPERLPRTVRELPPRPTGEPSRWPPCGPARRRG
jgi:carboxypeptidase Q